MDRLEELRLKVDKEVNRLKQNPEMARRGNTSRTDGDAVLGSALTYNQSKYSLSPQKYEDSFGNIDYKGCSNANRRSNYSDIKDYRSGGPRSDCSSPAMLSSPFGWDSALNDDLGFNNLRKKELDVHNTAMSHQSTLDISPKREKHYEKYEKYNHLNSYLEESGRSAALDRGKGYYPEEQHSSGRGGRRGRRGDSSHTYRNDSTNGYRDDDTEHNSRYREKRENAARMGRDGDDYSERNSGNGENINVERHYRNRSNAQMSNEGRKHADKGEFTPSSSYSSEDVYQPSFSYREPGGRRGLSSVVLPSVSQRTQLYVQPYPQQLAYQQPISQSYLPSPHPVSHTIHPTHPNTHMGTPIYPQIITPHGVSPHSLTQFGSPMSFIQQPGSLPPSYGPQMGGAAYQPSLPALAIASDSYNVEQQIQQQQEKLNQQKQKRQQLFQQMLNETEELERENSTIMSNLKGRNRHFMDDERAPQSPMTEASSANGNNSSATSQGRNRLNLDPYNDDSNGNYSSTKTRSRGSGDGTETSHALSLPSDRKQQQQQMLDAMDLAHQQEIRGIQHEMDRLKQQQQLDEYRAILDEEKNKKLEADRQIAFLREQKEQLQSVRTKQIAARERTLFRQFVKENIPQSMPSTFRQESDEDERFQNYLKAKSMHSKSNRDEVRKIMSTSLDSPVMSNVSNSSVSVSVSVSNMTNSSSNSNIRNSSISKENSNSVSISGGNNNVGSSSSSSSNNTNIRSNSKTTIIEEQTDQAVSGRILTDCGVGCEYFPAERSSGLLVLVDGLLMAQENQSNDEYRMTLHLYCAAGKPVARSASSNWKKWQPSHVISPTKYSLSTPRRDSRGEMDVMQLLNDPLISAVKRYTQKSFVERNVHPPTPTPMGGAEWGGDLESGVILGSIEGFSCVVELETRKHSNNGDDGGETSRKDSDIDYRRCDDNNNNNNNSSSSSVGWSIMPLTSSAPALTPLSLTHTILPHLNSPFFLAPPQSNLPDTEIPITIINNGLWRIALRKHPVNRVFNSLETDSPKGRESFIGWILLRIADLQNAAPANRWVPSQELRGVSEAMANYEDPKKTPFPLKRSMKNNVLSESESEQLEHTLEPLQQLHKWAQKWRKSSRNMDTEEDTRWTGEEEEVGVEERVVGGYVDVRTVSGTVCGDEDVSLQDMKVLLLKAADDQEKDVGRAKEKERERGEEEIRVEEDRERREEEMRREEDLLDDLRRKEQRERIEEEDRLQAEREREEEDARFTELEARMERERAIVLEEQKERKRLREEKKKLEDDALRSAEAETVKEKEGERGLEKESTALPVKPLDPSLESNPTLPDPNPTARSEPSPQDPAPVSPNPDPIVPKKARRTQSASNVPISMVDLLKLKIQKSERNMLLSSPNTSRSERKRSALQLQVQAEGSERLLNTGSVLDSLPLPLSYAGTPTDRSPGPGLGPKPPLSRAVSRPFEAWTKHPPAPPPEPYFPDRNQILEFCIDRATNLPENCTVSRVSVKFMKSFAHCDETSRESDYHCCHAPSHCYNSDPDFNFKRTRNIRDGFLSLDGPRLKDETTTAHIRIDSIDSHTLKPCVVGCTVIKIFTTAAGAQPIASGAACAVNTGMFQIPLFAGSLPLQKEGSKYNDSILTRLEYPRLPCASLLLRIRVLPPKNIPPAAGVGKSVRRSSKNFTELPSPGSPAPQSLSETQYDNTQCEPVSPTDWACQASRAYEALMMQQQQQRKAQMIPTHTQPQPHTPHAQSHEASSSSMYNSQCVPIETAITQSISNNKSSAIHFSRKPDLQEDEESTAAAVQRWVESLLPPTAQLGRRELLDYSFAAPYNKESGLAVCVHQLFHMPSVKRKGVFSAFSASPTHALYKTIYSILPGGLYYKNVTENLSSSSRLPWGIKFTEKTEPLSTPKNPIYSDGPKQFYPRNMNLSYNDSDNVNNEVFLVLDIRAVTVSVQAGPTQINSDLGNCYWAILPLSKESRDPEKGKKKSNRFINTGTFQLPLFEGIFPYKFVSDYMNGDLTESGAGAGARGFHGFDGILGAILDRQSSQATPDMLKGPWTLCPGGASAIVSVGNPLLSDFPGCTYDIGYVPKKKRKTMSSIEMISKKNKLLRESLDTQYLKGILQASGLNKANTSRTHSKDFLYDDRKYPPGKYSLEQLYKAENLKTLMRALNDHFSVSTGIPKQT